MRQRGPRTTDGEAITVDDEVDLAAELELLDEPYKPGIAGYLNDYELQAVKARGPFV